MLTLSDRWCPMLRHAVRNVELAFILKDTVLICIYSDALLFEERDGKTQK